MDVVIHRIHSHTYIIVERWKEEAAEQTHNTSAHFKTFVQQAGAYVVAAIN